MTKLALTAALAGIVIFALGGTAFATTGQNGPTSPSTPKIGDPVTSAQEIQVVDLGAPTGGSFTLTLGATTTAIAYNAAASATSGGNSVKEKLVTAGILPSAGTVSGNAGGPYKVAWPSSAGSKALLVVNSSLTGSTGTSVTEWQDGAVSVAGQVSPHGGYSSSTDFCLQCHEVHGAPDPGYALLAQANVTDTCATCHALFGASKPATAPTGGPGPGQTGTTSLRSAYDVSGAAAEHGRGASTIPASSVGMLTDASWEYGGFGDNGSGVSTRWTTSEAAGNGTANTTGGDAGGLGHLYCGSCHSAHGDFGQLVNLKYFRTTANGQNLNTTVSTYAEGGFFYMGRTGEFLHLDTDPAVWEACPVDTTDGSPVWTATAVTPVAAGRDTVNQTVTTLGVPVTTTVSCGFMTTTDSEGQTVSLIGYKLLSAYPNHSWTQGPESWGMDASNHDSARWCGRCHDKSVDAAYGGTFHAHPTGCTACHGNPSDNSSFDFPHTSTFGKFLKSYPDALCISCHTAGSLP